MKTYDIGDTVRLSVEFTDAAEAAADPTGVTVTIKVPSTAAVTYTYGTDAGVVKDSTGHYHYDFAPTVKGTHQYVFKGTGTIPAAAPGEFFVQPPNV